MWGVERGVGKCEGCEGCEGSEGNMGKGFHTLYIFPHFSHIPTHFSTSPLHTFPHLHTPTPSSHISPLLPPHFPTSFIFPPYLTQLSKLPKISQFLHHPYSSKLLKTLYIPHTPPLVLPTVTLLFTLLHPYQNFSLFSFIGKLAQQSIALETPCKFHKKN